MNLGFEVFSLPTLTLICLGLASAFLAMLIFSTPLSQLALTSQIDFFLCRFPQRLGFDQWRINQVFAQEPCLEFAAAEHVAHHQVVGARVSQFGGKLGEFTAMDDDDLVRIQ
jgi:hypothetical protein